MSWNRDRWLPEDHQPLPVRRPRSGRRVRGWTAIGVTVLALVSLAMPASDVAAAGKSSRTLIAEWSAVADVSVVQESSTAVSYRGTWRTASHTGYLGGKARSTRVRGARASLRFTGTAIAWVGPVGPTRGKARVYIDGTLVKTVNTWASSFRASRVLFTRTWATAGTHTITIIANGTAGHPTVALDAFVVRRAAPQSEPPAQGTSVRVTSIPALLTALADNAVTDIVVANGTYRVSPAASQRSDSLWIGARFASRTRPVTVRAETRGGVTFDGGGTTSFGGVSFVEGAHDQTWDGFNFANGQATETGVIMFGGYAGRAAPHHITLRNIKVLASCTGHNDRNDHAVYFSYAVGGPHDILIDGLTVDGTGPSPLSSALHFSHSDATNKNAWNTTIRRLVVSGTYTAVFLWDSTLHDITIDGATITNARYGAVQYEQPGQRIVLANMTSTGSGTFGFYSSAGNPPPGITFINTSFR